MSGALFVLFQLLFLFQSAHAQSTGPATFMNFETAPVHPVALGPDGRTLAVCNLPDGRVELFDVSSGTPSALGDIAVGVDPVSVRWRSAQELWVVNHISSSINIVDVPRRLIVATLQTGSGPSDLVFAGSPTRAYVSCSRENTVQVFDPHSRQRITTLNIQGDRPKSLDVSPDGSRVYVAIFESGNASTILAPRLTPLDVPPAHSVLSDPDGPHHGQDPPPNHGRTFDPPLSQYLDSNVVSRGSLVVKRNQEGRWMDDSQGDWTEFVTGSKAARSGRAPGWDMPDRDLAIIETANHGISYVSGLMNLCMSVGVNPVNGHIAVVGTDGKNEVRFEPVLRGVFLRVNLALIDPLTLKSTVLDLNPHLDYSVRSLPLAERARSIGDPRAIVWNAAGTRAYVTGMGSGNLVVLNAEGRRVMESSIDLGSGPTGMALDEARGRLHVFNRFSSTLTTVDLGTMSVVSTVSIYDPTPATIRAGRRLFYDTRVTSGLGCVSCASCHPDARMDRLAWDLGVPNGEMFNVAEVAVTNYFHPMKGAMLTRTLQDPDPEGQPRTFLHWRGDRASILDFHVTFPDLLAADHTPGVKEMRELSTFLASIAFPPNRYRNLDNQLSESVPLPGMVGVVTNGEPPLPLPPGNARRGLELFKRIPEPPLGKEFGEIRRNACADCHDCESGRGLDFLRVLAPRSDGFAFVGTPLRGLDERLGMHLGAGESQAGFGFFHDGRVDTLTRFLSDGFEMQDNQEIADLIAFLLSFSGGELNGCGDERLHIVRDGPVVTGRQITLTSPEPNAELRQIFEAAHREGTVWDYMKGSIKPSEFVVTGMQDGVSRRWWRNLEGRYVSDRNGDEATNIFALASSETPLTFTAVPFGAGRRLSIDRDDDGVYDLTEIAQGSDPLNVRSPSETPPPETADFQDQFTIAAYPGDHIDVALDNGGRWRGTVFGPRHPNNVISFEIMEPDQLPSGVELAGGGTRLSWKVPDQQAPGYWRSTLRAFDNARPGFGFANLVVSVIPANPIQLRVNASPFSRPNSEDTELEWDPVLGCTRYEIHAADSAGGPWKIVGSIHETRWLDRSSALGRPQRFYRVMAIRD